MTSKQRKKVKFVSRNVFRTRELIVEPDLLGLFHEFGYDSSIVRVELPPSDHLGKKRGLPHDLWLDVKAFRKADSGEEIPTQIEVRYVFVYVSQDGMFPVPAQALKVQPNAYDLFPENHQKSLEGLAESYGAIAREAFDLWLRTLRWKCMKWYVARPEIHRIETASSTYLLTADTKRPFWARSTGVAVYLSDPITLEEWESVQLSLKNGQKPPVYHDLLFDAREHFGIKDYVRTVIDAAVACETYLRTLVSRGLPQELNDIFREYIDDANIRQVLNHFICGILNEDETKRFKKINSVLHKLFNARNDIMHSGYFEGLKEEKEQKCKRYLDATRNLITLRVL